MRSSNAGANLARVGPAMQPAGISIACSCSVAHTITSSPPPLSLAQALPEIPVSLLLLLLLLSVSIYYSRSVRIPDRPPTEEPLVTAGARYLVFFYYRRDALPITQPTMTKQRRKK